VKPNRHFYPVIPADGRGTRFRPLSRKRRAKQLLALDGRETMLQQTVVRLRPIAQASQFWIMANRELRPAILRQVPRLNPQQILAEPVARNTAPAIGLAAFLLGRQDPDAVIGLFPADHVIGDPDLFRQTITQAAEIASSGENIVVLGIRPTRPETGYGYIEVGTAVGNASRLVRRFTEKPPADQARQFVEAGNYFWNSGMFIWSARTLANALREHLPQTAKILEKIAANFGTSRLAGAFRHLYPKCENISIDYAVLEPRSARGEGKSRIFCLPSEFGWNDLGSWTALHEHRSTKSKPADGNLISASGNFAVNARNNFVHAPRRFVAVAGVSGIVVVETDDALLITSLEHSQEVGKVVKHLDEKKLRKLV